MNILHTPPMPQATAACASQRLAQDGPDATPPKAGLGTGPFFSSALTWVDAVLTPQNFALAGRGLAWAARFPRRHPLPVAVLGASALYWAYRRSQPPTLRATLQDFSRANSQALQHCAQQTRRSLAEGYSAAATAKQDIRSSVHEIRENVQNAAAQFAENGRLAASRMGQSAAATAEIAREAYENALHSVSQSAEKVADTARQLQEDAEAAYRDAAKLAREKPALALAGGLALALGALLLAKSSRR